MGYRKRNRGRNTLYISSHTSCFVFISGAGPLFSFRSRVLHYAHPAFFYDAFGLSHVLFSVPYTFIPAPHSSYVIFLVRLLFILCIMRFLHTPHSTYFICLTFTSASLKHPYSFILLVFLLLITPHTFAHTSIFSFYIFTVRPLFYVLQPVFNFSYLRSTYYFVPHFFTHTTFFLKNYKK